jgi:UDP-N-acetylglucosamine 2-epimerase
VLVFGTRPEVIKLAPVIRQLEAHLCQVIEAGVARLAGLGADVVDALLEGSGRPGQLGHPG